METASAAVTVTMLAVPTPPFRRGFFCGVYMIALFVFGFAVGVFFGSYAMRRINRSRRFFARTYSSYTINGNRHNAMHNGDGDARMSHTGFPTDANGRVKNFENELQAMLRKLGIKRNGE